jgi:hypothetical protein
MWALEAYVCNQFIGSSLHKLHLCGFDDTWFFDPSQGCQMVFFQTKNPNLCKIWKALYVMEDVRIFYGHFGQFSSCLVYFMAT